MKELLMSAGTIASIVLCLVGIIKTPFKSFKEKHPTAYKIVFYILSLILSVGLPILAALFIMEMPVLSWYFSILEVGTIAGVFFGYTTYESTGLKKGLGKLCTKIKTLFDRYSDKKLPKTIEKLLKNNKVDGTALIETTKQVMESIKAEITAEQTVNTDVK